MDRVTLKSKQKDLHYFHNRPLRLKKLAYIIINFVDKLGYFIFRRFITIKSPVSSRRKILLSKNDHLGDVLIFLKLLPSIREKFKNSEIHLMVGSWAAPLVKGNPYIDRIIEYDDFYLIRNKSFFYKSTKYVSTFIRTLIILSKERYDLGIDFRGYFGNTILLLTIGRVKYRVGFSCGGFGWLLNKEVKWENGVHEIQHHIDILKALKLENLTPRDYFDYLVDNKAASELLRKNGVTEGETFVVFHPGTGSMSRYWSTEGWKSLSDAFSRKEIKVIYTGGNNEASIIEKILECSNAMHVNLAGQTDLKILAGIISKAKFVVALESFVAHLSTALGTPTISIFSGITDTNQWMPIGKGKVTVIKKEIECSPCYIKNGCKTMDCMKVDASSVFEDILRMGVL